MMFSNIHSLLKRGVSLNLVISAAGDEKIEVSVLPSSAKDGAASNLVAKTFTATAEELDAEFPQILAGYCEANVSLQDQLLAVKVMAEQVAKDASEQAVIAKPNKAAKTPGSRPVTTNKSPTLMEGGDDDDEAGEESSTSSESSNGVATASPSNSSDPMPFVL